MGTTTFACLACCMCSVPHLAVFLYKIVENFVEQQKQHFTSDFITLEDEGFGDKKSGEEKQEDQETPGAGTGGA